MLGAMNIFRLAADMCHLASLVYLCYKIMVTKSCKGISLKTVELYALVFLLRYVDLLTTFISLYNTIMKILFISISVAVVCLMRFHHVIRETYARDQDTVRYEMFIAGTAVLAFFVHEQIRPYGVTHYMIEIMWQTSIYLEAVAIVPQLKLLMKTDDIDTLTGKYVLLLGAYRALYILNWIYRYHTERYFKHWHVWIAGVVQTALYADFFYYYFKSWRLNKKLQVPTMCALREEQLCELTDLSFAGTAPSPSEQAGLRQRLLNSSHSPSDVRLEFAPSESHAALSPGTPSTPHTQITPHSSMHEASCTSGGDSSSSPAPRTPATGSDSDAVHHMHEPHAASPGQAAPQEFLQVVDVKAHQPPGAGGAT